MQNEKKSLGTALEITLLITFLVFVWSGVNPRDYFTWVLEVVPAIVALVILVATYRKFRFSDFTYILIAIHAMILMIGGHTTYAENAFFNYLKDIFDLERNYYDRLGHFAQGFVPALVANELLFRKNIINGRAWRYFLIIFAILGFSAFYEFFEWWAAIATGEAATAFLGTQGDVWDTQWDMFMCLLGSLTAIFGLARWQENKIKEK